MSDLPTNIDATYPDRSPADKLHQQHHDIIHAAINAGFSGGGLSSREVVDEGYGVDDEDVSDLVYGGALLVSGVSVETFTDGWTPDTPVSEGTTIQIGQQWYVAHPAYHRMPFEEPDWDSVDSSGVIVVGDAKWRRRTEYTQGFQWEPLTEYEQGTRFVLGDKMWVFVNGSTSGETEPDWDSGEWLNDGDGNWYVEQYVREWESNELAPFTHDATGYDVYVAGGGWSWTSTHWGRNPEPMTTGIEEPLWDDEVVDGSVMWNQEDAEDIPFARLTLALPDTAMKIDVFPAGETYILNLGRRGNDRAATSSLFTLMFDPRFDMWYDPWD